MKESKSCLMAEKPFDSYRMTLGLRELKRLVRDDGLDRIKQRKETFN